MKDPLNVLLFMTLSAAAVVASLHAWRTKQTYGFFRFLAFESLIMLIVLNTRYWFHEPFSIQQIISWTLFAGSTVLAAHGFYLLKNIGRARKRVVEDTQVVVEIGVYRFIRHPLYTALGLFGWGVFLKNTDLGRGAVTLVATIFIIITARYEERFNIGRFGERYSEYMKRTKMFIPYLL